MTLLDAAEEHLGEPGPTDTCLSNGIQRWSGEAGLPLAGGGTASVSAWRSALQSGDQDRAAGWTYHLGMAGVQVGDVLDWAAPLAHVSVVESIAGTGIRSIGSGGPTGKVAYQPSGGGYDAAGNFRGYARPPQLATAAAVAESQLNNTEPTTEGDEELKIYENAGPTAPAAATGQFFAGAPGVWLPIDNRKFGGDKYVRAILTDAFNAPIRMFSGDLAAVQALYLAAKQ